MRCEVEFLGSSDFCGCAVWRIHATEDLGAAHPEQRRAPRPSRYVISWRECADATAWPIDRAVPAGVESASPNSALSLRPQLGCAARGAWPTGSEIFKGWFAQCCRQCFDLCHHLVELSEEGFAEPCIKCACANDLRTPLRNQFRVDAVFGDQKGKRPRLHQARPCHFRHIDQRHGAMKPDGSAWGRRGGMPATLPTAATESRVSGLLGPRCLSQKELRSCNYDSGDESQRARKQQKVDREPGHDTLPTLIQAAPSHRGPRPLLQAGGKAAACCRNWGSSPRSGVAGAFEKEGRELPSPHGLTLAPRPMDARI
jgi:hypothetical protein